MDEAPYEFGLRLESGCSDIFSIGFVLRPGRWADLPFRAGGQTNRDHRSAGGKAVRLLEHARRRPVPRVPRLHAGPAGSGFPGRDRPAYAHRARLAARLAPQARCRAFKDRKSTRLNSSHEWISYAVFCLKKKKNNTAYIIGAI